MYGKVIRLMAHEVNNTVGPVNSFVQSALATGELWQNHQFNTLKDALQVAMERNQNLNHFMRNFADLVKLPMPKKNPTDLMKLINSVANLMHIKAGEKHIVSNFKLPPAACIIQADEQLLEQALINIVKNSIDAIEGEGSILFDLNPIEKTLTITDTGKGIRDEDNANLFSPFFSTKKDGQGIGLTLVREILLSHGFQFSLNGPPGGPTVFRIIF